jgi:hypothetical protein
MTFSGGPDVLHRLCRCFVGNRRYEEERSYVMSSGPSAGDCDNFRWKKMFELCR